MEAEYTDSLPAHTAGRKMTCRRLKQAQCRKYLRWCFRRGKSHKGSAHITWQKQEALTQLIMSLRYSIKCCIKSLTGKKLSLSGYCLAKADMVTYIRLSCLVASGDPVCAKRSGPDFQVTAWRTHDSALLAHT